MKSRHLLFTLPALLVLVADPMVQAADAPDTTSAAIAEYRAMFGDDNPAELWETRGEALWKEVRGPKAATLASCNLGMGPGVTRGAYAHLPRYFADTGRVQDMESRLLTCMTGIQGYEQSDLVKGRFGDGDRKSDLEALSAYLVAQSRGQKVDVPLRSAQERTAYETGKAIFYYRSGPHDFSCATCHSQTGKRIRLQALPNLADPVDARQAFTSWPAYRVSQGELRTLEWRLADCFRQQRLPGLKYGSEGAVALTMFLAHNANGGVMAAPAIKR